MDRPIQLVEVGTLATLPNQESQFIGSSTGIYFVNTVRRAFKASTSNPAAAEHPGAIDIGPDRPDPAVEGFIHDEEGPSSPASPENKKPANASIPRGPSYDAAPPGLGRPPDAATARRALIRYFRIWHPVFPILHGPTFMEEVDALYDPAKTIREDPVDPDRRRVCRVIIIQCVFNIVQAGIKEDMLPASSRIESAHSLLFSLSSLAMRQDLYSLQALLAAQLYLIAKGSMRSASAVMGLVTRSIFHCGLHRCPARYAQLSDHERGLRKRVFWCAYVLDRYLSQILGLPPSFQDSDVDVCVPGEEEVHDAPAAQVGQGSKKRRETMKDHLPRRSSTAPSTPATTTSYGRSSQKSGDELNWPANRDSVLAAMVGYSKLTGRIVELFHKSVHVRLVDHANISTLASDIDSWYFSLPEHLISFDVALNAQDCPPDEEVPSFAPMFQVFHHQLILLINRPCLSMSPASIEFKKSLQACIQASRAIIASLEKQVTSGQNIFLPELLSAAWMSGLILAFACQLKVYSVEKAHLEIKACLQILRSMSDHWKGAKHYYRTLDALFAHLHSSAADHSIASKKRKNEQQNGPRKKQSTQDLRNRPQDAHTSGGTYHQIAATASPLSSIHSVSHTPPASIEMSSNPHIYQHTPHSVQQIPSLHNPHQHPFHSPSPLYQTQQSRNFYEPTPTTQGQTPFLDAALLQNPQGLVQPGMPMFPEQAENVSYFQAQPDQHHHHQHLHQQAMYSAGWPGGPHDASGSSSNGSGTAMGLEGLWSGFSNGEDVVREQWSADPSAAVDIFGQLTWSSLNDKDFALI